MKLYARRGSGSDAVEAALAVIGTDCHVEYLAKGADGRPPASYLAVNPRGEVPALVLDGGTVMTESAAILLYLADSHPEAGLAPAPDSPQRPGFLRWLMFLAAAPYASALSFYYPHRYTADVAAAEVLKQKSSEFWTRDFGILSQAMGDGPFIQGNVMTVADIYAAMLISWVDDLPGLFAARPNLRQFCDNVLAVPAIGKCWQHIEF